MTQEGDDGTRMAFRGAHVSYRINARSIGDAASLLESYVDAQQPYDLLAEHQAYIDEVNFEVCQPEGIDPALQGPGVVSESGLFYFDQLDSD